MKLIGLMPVRNEDWCLGLTARAALMWCDAIEMYLHACTDSSLDIATAIQDEHPESVIITIEPRPQWDEMLHRQEMLAGARRHGATHIAIIDADELLTGNLLENAPAIHGGGTNESYIRNMVGVTRPGHILQLPGYNLRGSLDRYHANGIWGNRWFSTAFPDDPNLHWTGDTFHQREPLGLTLRPYRPVQQGQGGVLHLWGVSERRLKAKHALYKITERLRWPGKSVKSIESMYTLWRETPPVNGDWATYPSTMWPSPGKWEYGITQLDWLAPYAHLMRYLHVDAEPWQEAECRLLLSGHPDLSSGLDLFGVLD
jgi:hypothetical protein